MTAREPASPPPGRCCHREETRCRLRCPKHGSSPGSTGRPPSMRCACWTGPGRSLPSSPSRTRRRGSRRWCAAWPGTATRRICQWPSSGRPGGWSTCCWRPGTRWCRSARTRSRPGGKARCCPAPSPTPETPRSSPSTCGCAITGWPPPPRTATRPGPCAPWYAPAMTWSRCGSRPPTSCPPCWRRTGPAPRPSSPTSNRRSAWSS